MQSGASGTTPQNSVYTFTGVAASQQVNIDAGTSTAVNIALAAPGDLNVGTVTSRRGDVTLSAVGSILDATADTATNVTGNNITLTAGGSIGTAADPLLIDASHVSPGLVDATAAQVIALSQTSGNLTLGMVKAGTKAILSAAGAILGGGTSSPTLTAASAALAAGSEIGTAADPLATKLAALAATAGSDGIWLSNSGDLAIDASSVIGLSSSGPISLSTSGALNAGELIVTGGNISLTASGDITIPDGVLIQSSLGSVVLSSTGGNITLAALSTLSAGSAILLDGTASAGSTIILGGTMIGKSAGVVTGSGDDTIDVDRLPAGVALVDRWRWLHQSRQHAQHHRHAGQ